MIFDGPEFWSGCKNSGPLKRRSRGCKKIENHQNRPQKTIGGVFRTFRTQGIQKNTLEKDPSRLWGFFDLQTLQIYKNARKLPIPLRDTPL